jgi:hypothetical protein
MLLTLKKIGQKIASTIDFKDILISVGIIMAAKGIYMVYPPAMWVMVGVFFVYLGWPAAKAVK